MFNRKNQSGFTLMEIVIALGMFSVVMIIATGAFQGVVEGQRQAVNAQDVQESIRYALEVISKEMRTAQGHHAGSVCPVSPGRFKTFNTSETGGFDPVEGRSTGDEIYFENKDGHCVIYRLNNGQFEITRDDFVDPAVTLSITPDEVTVSNLEFTAINDPADEFHYLQGRVTVRMDVEAAAGREIHKQRMTVQTTVSSRFYE